VLSGAVAPHFTATSKTTSASTTESPTSVHVAHCDAHSDEDHRSSQAHLASNDRPTIRRDAIDSSAAVHARAAARASSTLEQVWKFVGDSVLSMGITALIPCAQVAFWLYGFSHDTGNVFYGEDAVRRPTIYLDPPDPKLVNVTCVPWSDDRYAEYMIEPGDKSMVEPAPDTLIYASLVFYALAIFIPVAATEYGVFRPTRAASVKIAVLTVAAITLWGCALAKRAELVAEFGELSGDGFAYMVLANAVTLVYIPVTAFIAVFSSSHMLRERWKAVAVFTVAYWFIGGVYSLYLLFVLDNFFAIESLPVKMALRGVLHPLVKQFSLQVLWLTSSCLVDLGIESDSSFLLYCPLLVMITMFGRLMQASAHSLAIAVCYELAATAGELWEGRDLMRGTTPGIKWQNFRRRVSRVATRVGIDLDQSGESCDEGQDPFSDPRAKQMDEEPSWASGAFSLKSSHELDMNVPRPSWASGGAFSLKSSRGLQLNAPKPSWSIGAFKLPGKSTTLPLVKPSQGAEVTGKPTYSPLTAGEAHQRPLPAPKQQYSPLHGGAKQKRPLPPGPLASELGSSSNLVTEPSPATMQQLTGMLSPRESSPAQEVFEEATGEGIANDDPRWREDEENRNDDEEGGDDIDDISPHSGDGVRENRGGQPSAFEIMRTVTPDATSPYHTGRTLASAVEDRRVTFCANVLIASMMAEAVTIFVATALNFTVPTNFDKFGAESEPLSDKQVLTNLCVMLVGELVLADGLLLLESRIGWCHMKRDLGKAWTQRDKLGHYLFMLICTVMPFLACGTVMRSMCLTSFVVHGTIDPDWVLTQCPPAPGSLDQIRRWGGAWNTTSRL